ncbi:metallophosphoesterase family protein [Legionella pneumophila]|uniref:metallophosphoesterase family protein n=1 Tax=Legionella pneumophila TaxID=446 RepID=UPI000770A57A|nr:DNA repair exonuclease [Legionella pneumophila]PYB42247.1 DNA repair exonuclease [Legionella pneumophila]PYB60775.1 DNA repair exonuclease [Legionella pneumophila]TID59170.1 DNA repair exonuclease [Legionella pneumophila]TID64230.1 DNA repair exonuclease [Legionella pneumophila]TID72853.1 DNA repair exonuclease [Legionella pneumophila]
MKFIHTADWQIGKQFANIKGDIAAFLREARFDVIKTIASLANNHKVDAILVAGDVFDANEVSDTTIRKTLNAMQEYKGPWILLPGNHDPALAQSVWTRMKDLPERTDNIILALEPEPISVVDNKLLIMPAPLRLRHEYRDLTEWYDSFQAPDSAFKVGLAHGSIEGFLPESAEIHNMISYQRTETANLDYLALGDWHGQLKVSSKAWYAGTPEQDRFHDNEPGKALLITLKEKGKEPKVESLDTGRYQWHRIQFDLYETKDIEGLNDHFSKYNPADSKVISLSLNGNLSLDNRQELDQLLDSWKAKFAMLDINDTNLKLNPTEQDLQELQSMGFLNNTMKELLAIRENESHEQHVYADRAIQMLWQELQSNKGVD